MVFLGMSTFICRFIPEKFVYWLNMGCPPRPNAWRQNERIIDWTWTVVQMKSDLNLLISGDHVGNKLCLKFYEIYELRRSCYRWNWLRLREFIAQKYMTVPSITLYLTRIKLVAALYLHDHKEISISLRVPLQLEDSIND